MKEKNVLFLVEYLYLGGIERLLEQLSLNIKESANITFFTYETQSLEGIGKQIVENGGTVYTYKKKPGRDWDLLKRLVEVVKEKKINIIHTHDFGPVEYAVILKFRFPWIKLIHTQHTIFHFVNRRKYTFFFQIASYFYCHLIAVSQHAADEITSHCPLMNKKKLIIISNGVDPEIFNIRPIINDDNAQKELKLISVARISHEKNINYLLNTCRLLKESGTPFVFHHAGTAKDIMITQKIYKYLNEHDLQKQVFLHGFLDDTTTVLELGDIFLSASHTEGNPVAVLEAMSSGKLCFCSDIPAHRELGEDVVVLFNKEEESALFWNLVKYFKDTDRFNEKNRLTMAREKVISNFSIKKMVDKYVEQYQ